MAQPIRDLDAFVQSTAGPVLDAIQRHDKHRVLYHADIDGLCAATALMHVIGRNAGKEPCHAWVPTSDFHFVGFVEDYSPGGGALTIAADINFSSRAGLLHQLDVLFGQALIIIDDHVINERPPAMLQMVNPNAGRERTDSVELASSLYAYKLATAAGCVLPEWLPILGLYFDRQLGLYRQLFTQSPEQSVLDRTIRRLSTGYLDDTADRSSDPALQLMLEASTGSVSWERFVAIVEAEEPLAQMEVAHQAEIEKHVRTARRSAAQLVLWGDQTVHLFEFTSHLQIANIVASRLRGQAEGGVYAAVRHGKEFAQCELRLGSNVQGVDLVDLLRQLSEDVPLTNYGGHARAAGAGLLTANVPRLVQALERLTAA